MGKDYANWMKYIPDGVTVAQLTIPGTHDSHALESNIVHEELPNHDILPFVDAVTLAYLVKQDIENRWGSTQSFPIWQQLLWGVRYIDIRVGNPYWQMWHGRVQLKERMEAILAGIHDSLVAQAKETVLVSIKWDEDDAPEPADTYDMVKSIWNQYSWFSGQYWPSLGEARGKAILLRRFGTTNNEPYGIDCTGFWGNEKHIDSTDKWWQQDNGTQELEKYQRADVGLASLIRAKGAPFDDKCVYFSGFAGFQKKLGGTPNDFADSVNPKVVSWLDSSDGKINPKTQRLGVIVLDFMSQEMTEKIVTKNFDD